MKHSLSKLVCAVAVTSGFVASGWSQDRGTGQPEAKAYVPLPTQSYVIIDVSGDTTAANSLSPLVAADDHDTVAFCYPYPLIPTAVMQWKNGVLTLVQTVPGYVEETSGNRITSHSYSVTCLDSNGTAYGRDAQEIVRGGLPWYQEDYGLICTNGVPSSSGFNDGCYDPDGFRWEGVIIFLANNVGNYIGAGSNIPLNDGFSTGVFQWVYSERNTAVFDSQYGNTTHPSTYPGTNLLFNNGGFDTSNGWNPILNDKGWVVGQVNPWYRFGGAPLPTLGLWDGSAMNLLPGLDGAPVADMDNEGHIVGQNRWDAANPGEPPGWFFDYQGGGQFSAVKYFPEVVPPPFRSKLAEIRPAIVSNEKSPTDHRYLVLTYALVRMSANPYDWRGGMLIWTRDPAQPEDKQWSFVRVQLPDKAAIDDIVAVSPDGVLTAIGCPDVTVPDAHYYHVFKLVPVDLAVDANRNGSIEFDKDATSPQRPFRFWVNDDHDSGESGEDLKGPATARTTSSTAPATWRTSRRLSFASPQSWSRWSKTERPNLASSGRTCPWAPRRLRCGSGPARPTSSRPITSRIVALPPRSSARTTSPMTTHRTMLAMAWPASSPARRACGCATT